MVEPPIVLDQLLNSAQVWRDGSKRPLSAADVVRCVLMVSLAATSTSAIARRLSGQAR